MIQINEIKEAKELKLKEFEKKRTKIYFSSKNKILIYNTILI